MVNKSVWNAHYQRDMSERVKVFPGYTRRTDAFNHKYFAKYFLYNNWEGQVHKFAWLIDHFWPLPTPDTIRQGEKYPWLDNWKELYKKKFKQ